MQGKYNYFILDLDGTVYVDCVPIKNIISQLNKLVEENCKILFLTNNTSVDKASYVKKMYDLGCLFANDENVLTPIDIFLRYAEKHKIKSVYYLLPNEVVKYIERQNGPAFNDRNPDITLVGFDKELTYAKLQRASELVNAGVPYYITHIDFACPSKFGPIPDCGAITASLAHTTEKEYENHFGKPGELMADVIKELINCEENASAVLIGDRYYTDIKLGCLINVDTVHVNTGELNKLPEPSFEPTYEFDNITEFIEWQYITK